MSTAFLLFTLLFTTFPADTGNQNYFPLRVGLQWIYNMPMPNGNMEQVVSIPEYMSDYNAYLVRTIFKLGGAFPVTNEELIEPRKSMILLIGARGGLLSTDWQYLSDQVLFQYPAKLNQSWKYVDQNKSTLEYKVVSFDSLTVQAGKFGNVCKVKKVLKYHPKNSKKTVIGSQVYLYYAPGVGLLKEEMINSDNTTTTFRELTKFTTN